MERRAIIINSLTALLTLTAFGAGVWRFAIVPRGGPTSVETAIRTDWQTYAIGGTKLGVENADVVLVEFLAFTCPVCARAADYVTKLPQRFDGRVAIVFRHSPTVTQGSAAAALAAICADEAGLFLEYSRRLFARRTEFVQEPWLRIAREAGVNNTQSFADCLVSDAANARLAADTMAAKELGVTRVPTFLINEIYIPGYPGERSLDSLIVHALSEAEALRGKE